MRLYTYWRSSSAWRVRIALALKGVAYESVPIHLLRSGGEQHGQDFLQRNPLAQVPVLELEQGGRVVELMQSVAIVEYLEESFPEPPLLPSDSWQRALVRELVEIINSGTQPLQNLRVLQRVAELGGDRQAWAREWTARGLSALETRARGSSGEYLVGDRVTLADVYLVPQLYNARRFGLPMGDYPTLVRVDETCSKLEAFRAAHPQSQPDAEPA